MIRIVAVGKKHEAWINEGLKRYEKRLTKPWSVEWVLLPHSSFSSDRAREEESERILSSIKPADYVILLDEVGKSLDSPAVSRLIGRAQVHSKPIVLVIGGAYGVSGAMRERADFIWSLSDLVFPHQLVRLMLIEQLYRSQEIAKSGSYHHL